MFESSQPEVFPEGHIELRLSRGGAAAVPARFPWADDDEVEALENEVAAMQERYR